MISNDLGISNHSDTDQDWVTTELVNHSIYWKENPIKDATVPDVRGMTLRDAIFILENAGLKVIVEGQGRIATQSMYPGAKFQVGERIKLELS